MKNRIFYGLFYSLNPTDSYFDNLILYRGSGFLSLVRHTWTNFLACGKFQMDKIKYHILKGKMQSTCSLVCMTPNNQLNCKFTHNDSDGIAQIQTEGLRDKVLNLNI